MHISMSINLIPTSRDLCSDFLEHLESSFEALEHVKESKIMSVLLITGKNFSEDCVKDFVA